MIDEEPVRFGDRVKEARAILKLNQKEFARAVGISGSFLSEVEAGRTKAGYEFFYNIIKAFNVNPVYLLHGTGEVFLQPEKVKKEEKGEKGEKTCEYKGPETEIVKRILEAFEEHSVVRFAVFDFFERYMFDNREMLEYSIGRDRRKKQVNDPQLEAKQ